MNCPICGSPPVVVSQGAYGYLAHCSGCYEGDPEAADWRRMHGHGHDPEEALDWWFERASDEACSDLHLFPAPVRINYLMRDLQIQVMDESERMSTWKKKLQFKWSLSGSFQVSAEVWSSC